MQKDYSYLNNPDPRIIQYQAALGQKESGNNPNPNPTRITTTEGSVGRFQYLPATFKELGDRYFGGINPTTGKKLDIHNDLDQKMLNYAYVKDKMDQGYSPYDIAASWNAGEGRISDWQNMRGVNSAGNKYDVPEYANQVVKMYKDNMRKLQDPTYQPTAYDPRVDSLDAIQTDEYVKQQLIDKQTQHDQELQDYKDRDPIIPFLDPVTDWMGDYSEGLKKDANQFVNNAATSLNGIFGFSDNPMLIRGTKSNDYFTGTQNEADNTAQALGSGTGAILRTVAEMYGGTKLASMALGALGSGAAGTTLQKAILNQGVTGMLTRAGLGSLAQQVPFSVDDYLQNNKLTLEGTTVPLAVTAIAEMIMHRPGAAVGAVTKIAERISALRAAGKIEEAEKLVSSKEFTNALYNAGFKDTKALEDYAVKTELPKIRTALTETLPTTASTKVAEMSDDAIRQAAANFSKTLDSEGNFSTIDDIMKIRKGASELMDKSDELVKNVDRTLTMANKNIPLESFKTEIIRDARNAVKDGKMLQEDADKIVKFTERNIKTNPKGGAFEYLHNVRKKLNLDYTDDNYDAARFVADRIRRLVKRMPNTPEISAYKNANKVYGDLLDAEYILSKLNKKGANINKNLISSLSGIIASGGGFAPIQYFLGQRMGVFMSDKLKRVYTSRLIPNRASKIGTNPLVSATQLVEDAIKGSKAKITKLEGEITKDKIAQVASTYLNAKTPEDIKNVKKLLRSLANHPQFKVFEDLLNKKAAKINTRRELEAFWNEPYLKDDQLKTIAMGEPGVSKYKQVDSKLPTISNETPLDVGPKSQNVSEPYTPDSELPTIQMGKAAISKIKKKMIDSGIGLPQILTMVMGGTFLAGGADQASAMTADGEQPEQSIFSKLNETLFGDKETVYNPDYAEVVDEGSGPTAIEGEQVITNKEAPKEEIKDPKKYYPKPKLTDKEIAKIRATLFVEAGGKNQKEIQNQAEKIIKVLYNRQENGKDNFKGKNLAQLIDEKEFDGLRMKATSTDYKRILNGKYKPTDNIKLEAINWALDNLLNGNITRENEHLFYSAIGSDFRTYMTNTEQMADRIVDKKRNMIGFKKKK